MDERQGTNEATTGGMIVLQWIGILPAAILGGIGAGLVGILIKFIFVSFTSI
jgi:hypothetical protein